MILNQLYFIEQESNSKHYNHKVLLHKKNLILNLLLNDYPSHLRVISCVISFNLIDFKKGISLIYHKFLVKFL
jgi:hypothetical protein